MMTYNFELLSAMLLIAVSQAVFHVISDPESFLVFLGSPQKNTHFREAFQKTLFRGLSLGRLIEPLSVFCFCEQLNI